MSDLSPIPMIAGLAGAALAFAFHFWAERQEKEDKRTPDAPQSHTQAAAHLGAIQRGNYTVMVKPRDFSSRRAAQRFVLTMRPTQELPSDLFAHHELSGQQLRPH